MGEVAGAGVGDAEFDGLMEEAMEHYGERRYGQAIVLFERAYGIRQEPELVYNIARCHERLLHPEAAAEHYQRFLELPGTTGELRARALTNLTNIRQELAAIEAARQAEAAGQGEGQQGTQQNQSTESGGGQAVPIREPQPTGPSSLAIAGYALLGVGVATTIVGAVFWGLAFSSNNDFQEAGTDESRLQLSEDLRTRGLVGDIVFFSGLAVLGVGVALVAVNAVRRRSASSEGRRPSMGGLVFSPSLTGDGGGLRISGRF